MQRYDNNNRPKVGEVVFVTEGCWYEPYRNTWQVVTEWDLKDPWLTGCDEYPTGVCVEANRLVKPTPYSESNRPKIGDKVVLLKSEEASNGADQCFGKVFTVIEDDYDPEGLPILIDCSVSDGGLYVELSDITPANPYADPVTGGYVVTETNPYDLPCDFKVGDEVECLTRGVGVVVEISDGNLFPFDVRFNSGSCGTYTLSGSIWPDRPRTLFHKGTVKLVAIEQQYEPQYEPGSCLYAMKDGKIIVLEVKQDYKDRVVDNEGFVFLKSEFTFHLPA
jgi:hypothetical protein